MLSTWYICWAPRYRLGIQKWIKHRLNSQIIPTPGLHQHINKYGSAKLEWALFLGIPWEFPEQPHKQASFSVPNRHPWTSLFLPLGPSNSLTFHPLSQLRQLRTAPGLLSSQPGQLENERKPLPRYTPLMLSKIKMQAYVLWTSFC